MKHLIFLTLFAVFMLPSISQAYFTTAQNAFTVDNKVAVFTIDFKFGHKNHDIYIPVIAKNTTEVRDGVLSYQILDDDNEPAKGTAVGIVLSEARVQNGMYVVPKGKSMTFTLLTLFTPDTTTSENAFKTHVMHLPFSFDNTLALKLNPSELQYYTTPLVTLDN